MNGSGNTSSPPPSVRPIPNLERFARITSYNVCYTRLLRQSRTIRLPVHVSDDINRLIKVSRNLLQQHNREPHVKEVAEAMGVEVAYVRRLMVLLKKTYSFEHPSYNFV